MKKIRTCARVAHAVSCAHLLVGKEVDDGVVDGTGLSKVHGHGGEQRRDVQLRVHHHHHR